MSAYVPLDGKPFRLAMGLRALDLDLWFERDGYVPDQLIEKHRLLAERLGDVFVAEERCLPAAKELASLVSAFTQRSIHEVNEHPLVSAAKLVPDDLCIMERGADGWQLTGAVVTFPSRWNLAKKLGQSLDGIHDVVPGYHEQLASPVNALFDRLTPQRSFWRLNWTLLDSPELYLPPRTTPGESAVEEWYFRVERQTLRQLPQTGAIIFTIRTYVTSLTDLVASNAQYGPALLTAVETAPEATQEYKGWRGIADDLRRRLAVR